LGLNDEELIGTEELAADGTDVIFTGATVVSTTASSKLVVLSGVDLFRAPQELEENDRVTLAGTSGADGDYTVDEVIDLTSFTVKESIADSTGGTCTAAFRTGAKATGFDPVGLTNISASNVQEALEEVDAAISAGGITADAHKILRQLIHFIDDGPAEGFASGAYREVTGGVFPTAVVWWESSSKLKKIVEKLITRSGGGATNVTPTPIKWKIYDTDGSTVLWTISDAVTYSGVFEQNRTRTITAGDA